MLIDVNRLYRGLKPTISNILPASGVYRFDHPQQENIQARSYKIQNFVRLSAFLIWLKDVSPWSGFGDHRHQEGSLDDVLRCRERVLTVYHMAASNFVGSEMRFWAVSFHLSNIFHPQRLKTDSIESWLIPKPSPAGLLISGCEAWHEARRRVLNSSRRQDQSLKPPHNQQIWSPFFLQKFHCTGQIIGSTWNRPELLQMALKKCIPLVFCLRIQVPVRLRSGRSWNPSWKVKPCAIRWGTKRSSSPSESERLPNR